MSPRRSKIWCAAYVAAWQRNQHARRWPADSEYGEGEPAPIDAIARVCAAEADRCEAGYLAAFGAAE